MAVSATFVAKFDQFYDGVDKAIGKLDQLQGKATDVGGSFDKFRIPDAEFNAKLAEIDKSLDAIDASAGPAAESVEGLTGGLSLLGGTALIGGVVTLAGVVGGLVHSIIDNAVAMTKLSDETDISINSLEQFKLAAEASGTTIDVVAKAIATMQEKISGGDKSAVKALEDMGISLGEIQNSSADEKFRRIIDAAGYISDKNQALRDMKDIFGDLGDKILPIAKEGLDKFKLSLDESQDAMKREIAENKKDWDEFWKWFVGAAERYSLQAFAKIYEGRNAARALLGMGQVDLKGPDVGPLPKVGAPGYAAPVGDQAAFGKVLAYASDVKAAAKDVQLSNAAIDKANAETERQAKKTQDAIDKYNDSLKKIGDRLSGGDLIDKANDYIVALRNTVNPANMTRQAQDDINKVMGEAITAFQALGSVAPEEMYKVYNATRKPIPEVEKFTDSVKYLGTEQMPLFARQTVDAMGTAVGGVKGLEQAGVTLKDRFAGTLRGIPDTIIAAFTGGGGMTGAIAAIGMQLGQDFSAALEASIKKTIGSGGSILTAKNIGMAGGAGAMSGVGAMAGGATVGQSVGTVAMTGMSVAMMGGMTSASIALGAATMGIGTAAVFAYYGIRKWMDSIKERKATNTAREDYIDLAGGLDRLNESAWKAGMTLDDLLAAKNTDEAKAAIDGLNEAFQFQQASLDLVTATAEKYGFTLEELGPALQRSNLDKQAQELFQDWEVLNAAGIDTVAITTRMGDAASDYLQKALKFGIEVPEAMRPMLESMAKAGTLTDENGEKIGDLEAAGVKFSLTMSEGFKQLIGSVDRLAEVISRSLGVALENTGNQIKNIPKQVDVEVRYKQTVTGQAPNMEAPEEVEGFASGTNGFRNFGAGTPVILHGWEAVVPRTGRSQPGPGLTDDGGTTIVINAQGAFFDTPGSLQQLADRVDAALSARHGLKNKRRAA